MPIQELGCNEAVAMIATHHESRSPHRFLVKDIKQSMNEKQRYFCMKN